MVLINGDSAEALKNIGDNCIDSCVSDPPYFVSFMGKKWDAVKDRKDAIKKFLPIFKEIYRVLKPGAHCCVFALPRTSHITAILLEDAGFEIRDSIHWTFGSGFPKSHNIHKALKSKGDWQGWGTALKPSHELIWLARKPLGEKTVAKNVLKHGTGGLNIDASRVGFTDDNDAKQMENASKRMSGNTAKSNFGLTITGKTIKPNPVSNQGRFPANFILECVCENPKKAQEEVSIHSNGKGNTGDKGIYGKFDKVKPGNEKAVSYTVAHEPTCPCAVLDEQSGNKCGAQAPVTGKEPSHSKKNAIYGDYSMVEGKAATPKDAPGGASRFFKQIEQQVDEAPPFQYVPKASSKERNMGMDTANKETNVHPTVKPIKLMAYLIGLVTPPGGIVLDPFAGSGSTGIAAEQNGFGYVLVEREKEYCEIIKKRIKSVKVANEDVEVEPEPPVEDIVVEDV